MFVAIFVHFLRCSAGVPAWATARRARSAIGAALALHFAWYNFCRIHESLRVTPTMAAGLSDHVWEVEELVLHALAEPMPEPAPLAPIPSPDGWRSPEQLGLFDGLPGVLPKLLPPSVGGTPSANDNAVQSLAKTTPKLDDDDEGPATARDPAPRSHLTAPPAEWYALEGGDARVV